MTAVSGERLLTDKIIDTIAAADIPCGDGEQPAGVGWQGNPDASVFVPFTVLHPIAGGVTTGTMDDWVADAQLIYQVSCHGSTRRQCQGLIDAVKPLMIGLHSATVTGWTVFHVDIDMNGGATRMDTVQPAQWWGFPRYRFTLTPS